MPFILFTQVFVLVLTPRLRRFPNVHKYIFIRLLSGSSLASIFLLVCCTFSGHQFLTYLWTSCVESNNNPQSSQACAFSAIVISCSKFSSMWTVWTPTDEWPDLVFYKVFFAKMVEKKSIIQMKNGDELCCARALVTAIVCVEKDPRWNSIRQGHSKRACSETTWTSQCTFGQIWYWKMLNNFKTFCPFIKYTYCQRNTLMRSCLAARKGEFWFIYTITTTITLSSRLWLNISCYNS